MATEQQPVLFPLAGKRVWVAGHRGMVGSAMVRRLASEECELLTVDRSGLDLSRQQAVEDWVQRNRPDVIFLAAGRVGGIQDNKAHPGSFLYENTALETNIMEAARRSGVSKLIQLGSSCIYPRLGTQPIAEEELLTGMLEPTNEAYAIAKIANLKMAQAYRREYGCDFITAVLTNLYGPGDHFGLENSHVLPALIRKTHDAQIQNLRDITIWGSGTPRREFLYVDDCADALVFLAKRYSGDQHINVGSGEDVSILDLARLIGDIAGFKGGIQTDPSKPDGMPRKLLSIARLNGMGWMPRISLKDGITATYRWFLENNPEKHVPGSR